MRRNYSICAPPSLRRAADRREAAARRRVLRAASLDALQVGDELDVMTPAGRFTTELDPARREALRRASRPAPASRRCCRSWRRARGRAGLAGDAGLRQPDAPDGDVPRGARRTSRTATPSGFQLVHVLSREPQEVELFSGRLDGDRLRRILDALLPVDAVDEWFLCGP